MCTVLLFIVYTVTDIVYYLNYCSPCIRLLLTGILCHPGILSNIILISLTELNNNGQLTLGLGKLVKETMSVFWVDLGYRLCSQLTAPLQGFKG